MKNSGMKEFGNSGCSIEIFEDYVKKTSASVDYNKRLILQITKQMSYSGNFSTPKVSSITTEPDGRISVCMDNVGTPVALSDHYSVVLEQMLNWHLGKSYGKIDFTNQIMAKFYEVAGKILDRDLASRVIERASRESFILPIGYCHGDLTLSNIITSHGEFYLIDFLEDWIPSPAFDMCKILQDCLYKWYTISGEPFKQWHQTMGENIFLEYEKNHGIEHIPGVMLLTLFRILPYCENTPKGDFIKEILCEKFL